MTVPQPAPDHRAADSTAGHDPWAAPPLTPAEEGPTPRPWGREIRDGLLALAVAAAPTALAVGLLWLWLAPRVPLVSDGQAVLLANSEGQQAIGADGTFLLLGLGAGALAGVAVFLLRRAGGLGTVLGLAAGALLGSWLAWRLGVWLGPTDDVAAHAREAGEGEIFDGPLDLGARGVLLGLPFAAVAAHLICVALFGPREPRPVPPAALPWGQAPAANEPGGPPPA
ncbi:ABC transporter permease [Streptomyces sp. DSM 44917]|uniref:ABC transporter permease n=1 Tax=Streptomyces boetiae TaxID=3075541 RepID=A0ABU2LC94_9ACTN|nr:ABC transporter permease [Streptomyces sp. DSM 44917]MDT0309201.1 ABC transporter permease [Streptomyces sp. DSM 44917]